MRKKSDREKMATLRPPGSSPRMPPAYGFTNPFRYARAARTWSDLVARPTRPAIAPFLVVAVRIRCSQPNWANGGFKYRAPACPQARNRPCYRARRPLGEDRRRGCAHVLMKHGAGEAWGGDSRHPP